MNSEEYAGRTEQLLLLHCDALAIDGASNLQNSAVLSENFFRDLLNLVYD